GHTDIGCRRTRIGDCYREFAYVGPDEPILGDGRVVVTAEVTRAERRDGTGALANAVHAAQTLHGIAIFGEDHGLAAAIEAAISRLLPMAFTVADSAIRAAVRRTGEIIVAVAIVAQLTALDRAVAARLAATGVESGGIALAGAPTAGHPEI